VDWYPYKVKPKIAHKKETNGFEALDIRSTRQAAETPETRKLFIKV
jgi:hypothetical protein